MEFPGAGVTGSCKEQGVLGLELGASERAADVLITTQPSFHLGMFLLKASY